FFQAEDGIRYPLVTGVQTCALPILRVTCHSLRLEFRFDIFRWIEILHFPGDLAFQIAGIKKSDRSNAATTAEQRIPESFQPNSVRREHPHPGNNDAVSLNHDATPQRRNPLVLPEVISEQAYG